MPRDGGGFVLTEEEKKELEAKEPLSSKWIRLYILFPRATSRL
jgi:hypothetical protein